MVKRNFVVDYPVRWCLSILASKLELVKENSLASGLQTSGQEERRLKYEYLPTQFSTLYRKLKWHTVGDWNKTRSINLYVSY